jgi:hypothetical protein
MARACSSGKTAAPRRSRWYIRRASWKPRREARAALLRFTLPPGSMMSPVKMLTGAQEKENEIDG